MLTLALERRRPAKIVELYCSQAQVSRLLSWFVQCSSDSCSGTTDSYALAPSTQYGGWHPRDQKLGSITLRSGSLVCLYARRYHMGLSWNLICTRHGAAVLACCHAKLFHRNLWFIPALWTVAVGIGGSLIAWHLQCRIQQKFGCEYPIREAGYKIETKSVSSGLHGNPGRAPTTRDLGWTEVNRHW